MIEKNINIEPWANLIARRVRRPSIRTAALKYIERLIAVGVPPIFDFEHLSELVGVHRAILAGFVESAGSFYRTFKIPKQSGGFREISSPVPSLLMVQRWIKENILDEIPVHGAAHGFVKGKSVVTFAQPHVNKAALLHIDVSDFFPSIDLKKVYVLFRNIGYAPNVSLFLARLCCVNGRLPQGAPTSPSISNIIFSSIDARLIGLGCVAKLDYTRYADNIVFSGNYINIKFLDIVSEILSENSFKVNRKKTFLSTKRGKRIIAGISVSGERISLPRDTRRNLRQQVHGLLKFGFFEHTAHIGDLDPIYAERVLGRLLFWKYVEPNNSYVASSIQALRGMQMDLDSQV
ncbi:RNA-directed DNA polymerase [Burkholderia cenocepacia]|uniref:reverse transcriptase domain-containing protein n=1 Tax=Burkholderia cenocepacia TaxID=95486 RepID=UPI000F5A4C71|nr:reverse transcriptase domain-containing protein [Burkholderia cenocepacia]RQU00547.1 RNA-directed DNA polymerase [Burkholderia cenocepacia]RQU59815.1 RNA-directed DNA polymerase [Burkholderia cenocepacia]